MMPQPRPGLPPRPAFRSGIPTPNAPSFDAHEGSVEPPIHAYASLGQDIADSLPVEQLEDKVKSLHAENMLLGRLLQESQTKLQQSQARSKELSLQLAQRDELSASLQEQLQDREEQLQLLQQRCEQHHAEKSVLDEAHHREASRRAELEALVVQLSRQLGDRDVVAGRLEDRCAALSAELEGLRGSSVTAGHVSQQLRRVEEAYAVRLEAVRREAAEQLAEAREGAARQLAGAQGAATKLLARLKTAALHEVQRAEAFLEGKTRDQLRVLDQLSKRCRLLEGWVAEARPLGEQLAAERRRAAALERQLGEAAAGRSGRGSGPGGGLVPEHSLLEMQSRLRGEVVTATEALVDVQQQLAAAQAGRVAAEERLEETEARLRVLREETLALRSQLSALIVGQQAPMAHAQGASAEAAGLSASLQREAAAHHAALAAAQQEAAAQEALTAARREAAAAARALVAQLRRVQALEALRLKDLQELHQVEQQLAALRKEQAAL